MKIPLSGGEGGLFLDQIGSLDSVFIFRRQEEVGTFHTCVPVYWFASDTYVLVLQILFCGLKYWYRDPGDDSTAEIVPHSCHPQGACCLPRPRGPAGLVLGSGHL